MEVKKVYGPPVAYWDEKNKRFIPYTEREQAAMGPTTDTETMVLTNYHVVENMVRGKVKVSVGGNVASEWWIQALEAVDASNDLALISLATAIDLDVPKESRVIPPRPPKGLQLSAVNDVIVGTDIMG